MGCDYYLINCLEVTYKELCSDGLPRTEIIELETERHWFIPVEDEEYMSEEEYDQCTDKYMPLDEPIIVYENGEFASARLQKYFTREGKYLAYIDLSQVQMIRKIQYTRDRY